MFGAGGGTLGIGNLERGRGGVVVGWRGRRLWIIETYEVLLMAMVAVAT